MKGTRLRIEDKVNRIEEFIKEQKTFFSIKEIEKRCQKEKGVVSNSVKEVIDILVSEGRIKEERIGCTKYYWCFVSDTRIQKNNKKELLAAELDSLIKKNLALEERVTSLRKNRVPSAKRTEDLGSLQKCQESLSSLNKQLEIHKENDPEEILELEKTISFLIEEVNKWTESIFLFRSYITSSMHINASDFNKNFSIPQDLDTIG